jgi:hypothetical protein
MKTQELHFSQCHLAFSYARKNQAQFPRYYFRHSIGNIAPAFSGVMVTLSNEAA